MPSFLFRHFSFHRSQIMGRRLRAMRIRLARKRRFIRRVRRSLKALKFAAAEIRGENQLTSAYNSLANQLVLDCLVQLESDPLIRNALERFNAPNLGRNVNQAQPFRNGISAGNRRE